MTLQRGPGDQDDVPSPQRRVFRSGTLLIIGFGIFLLVGWVFYRQTMPPAWLYDFSEAVALHASPDPSPPEPEDIRQVSPPVQVDDPYICLENVIDLDWDHLFVVTSGQDLRTHPALSQSVWLDQPLSHYVDLMARDERYQLLVLVNANTVLDAQLYFTFWGDLSPIARTEGFSRSEAVFTAASLNGLYIVSPALEVPVGTCS
tara:strand:+ start:2193 stop:2801 length:609 start_codon:yes stop_codon:yes gene_type:complete